MKILMLCHRAPYPPDKGEKIRALHLLRGLARKHSVTLLALSDEGREAEAAEGLRPLVEHLEIVRISPSTARLQSLLALAGGEAMSVRYFHEPTMAARVRRLLERGEHDAVFVYCSAMAQYVRGVPIVVDFVDMDSQKYAQYARHRRFPASRVYAAEARRLRRYERSVADIARMNVFVSESEAALLRRLAPAAPVAVVPLTVDAERFAPPASGGRPGPPTVVFVGVMDYFPNVDAVTTFARNIWPRIRRSHPHARFQIVGQRPAARVRALGRIPGIDVIGAVPDVLPYLQTAAVAVAPFRIAQGMQTKILEAMAVGLPVVATLKVARALEARSGEHFFVEAEDEAFARSVSRLLSDEALRREIGRRARRFVEERHAPEVAWSKLDGILGDVVAGVSRNGVTSPAMGEQP